MLLYENHRPAADRQAVVSAVAFAPDGNTLASGAADGSLALRDAAGRLHLLLENGQRTPQIHSVGYLPDGSLVVGHAKGWEVFRQDDGAWRLIDPPAPAPVAALAVLDQHTLAIGTASDREKPTARTFELWDIRTRQVLPPAVAEPNGVRAIAACRAKERVAWVTGHRKAVVWDIRRQDRVQFMFPKDTRAVALSPDGTSLAVAVDRDVRLYDVDNKRERAVLKGHVGRVAAVAFSPDGQTVATGAEDATVRLWDSAAGRERAAYKWPVGRVYAVAYAPDGLRMAAGGERGSVVVWDTE
jgi:WD40 repeat protein